jgi:hypothetical protein
MGEEITRPIILLSGPVGAGKTTVAKALIKSTTTPTVYIEGDKFWFFIVKGDKAIERKKNFGTIMWSMVAASVPYACGGYEVILDFSIPPWFLDSALKITRTRNVPLEYIVIKPSENICAQRAAHRKEGVIADYSVYHDFYLDFAGAEKYSISDDLGDAESIANTINKSRKKGKFNIIRS